MLSLLSWGVIISKSISLFRMKRADEEFLKLYRGGRQPLQVFERNYEDPMSLRWVIYDHGAQAAAFQMLGSPERDETFSVRLRSAEGMTPAQMKLVQEGLGRGELAASARLRDGMPLLAVTYLVAPFVGLLGMAWLLMKTFAQNGTASTLAEVSPGVSGGLAVMVVGLIVGVPALIGQILLGAACRERNRVLGDFRSEFGRALEYHYGSGQGMVQTYDEETTNHHDRPLTAYDRAHAAALDGDGIENAAASLEANADAERYSADSPFVLIEEDLSATEERPIAAFANPEDDQPSLKEGFLFRTPFVESDEDVNPIAKQTAGLVSGGRHAMA